jgi:F-type H+-transporting ATPase subunit b
MDRQSASSTRASVVALALGLLAALPAHAATGSLEIFPDQRIFYLIAIFVLLVFPVNKLLFHPVFRVLDERDARIEGARKRAEEVGAQAEATLERYRSAVRSARESVESDRKAVLEQARREQAQLTGGVRSEAEATMSRARDEVARALGEARSQLREQAQVLAREAAARVLGRSLH